LDDFVENLEGPLKGRAESGPIGAQGEEQLDEGLPEVVQCLRLGLAVAKNVGLRMMHRDSLGLPVGLNVEGRRKLKARVVEAPDKQVCRFLGRMGSPNAHE